jgi:mannan endo-1,4-beta-mannosidase
MARVNLAGSMAVTQRLPLLEEHLAVLQFIARWPEVCTDAAALAAPHGQFNSSAGRAYQPGELRDGFLGPVLAVNGIIAGDYDVYLRRFAAEVKAFGHPVVISFGHEANGDWFGYGYKHTAPGTFIAAYRTVHDVITRAGATNVVWLWTVNIPAEHQTEPDAAVWPGASYVTWAGIDGYDWTGKATFTQTFGAAVAAVRAITSKPVLIAETSVVPGPHAASQVASLFAGIRADGLIGLVWFNTDKNGFKNTGDTHDWRLQNDPAGLAAFRAAIKNWR